MTKKILELLPNTLQSRLAIIIISINLFLFVTFGILSSSMQSSQLSSNLKQNAQTISKMLASSIESHMLIEDLVEAQQSLLYGSQLQNVNKIYLFDKDGRFLFGAAKNEFAKIELKFNEDEFAKLPPKIEAYAESNNKIIITEPIQVQNPIGYLRFEFNTKDIAEMKSILLQNILVFGCISLVVSLGLIMIVFKPITESIHRLADFAKKLDTNAGLHIELSSNFSEISLLTDSLNSTSMKLHTKECEIAHQHEELHELNESLKERVAEAVADVMEKDRVMFQQARLASMGEMIGNIAHQWRQPLNNISITVQDMKYEYKHEKTLSEAYIADTVESIMKQVRYMSKTIDDFRNFFRPDKAKSDFSVDLEVRKAIEFIKPSLTEHNITIDVIKHNPYNVTAFGHANEYVQVLMNILSNAKDAAIINDVKNAIICVEIAKKDDKTIVKIRDNAGGIPQEIIEKIFDPYFTTKGPQEGTGIGLYMAKMIIEKNMNGKLEIANVDGGAEFTITV